MSISLSCTHRHTAKSTAHFHKLLHLMVNSHTLMFSDVYTDFNTLLSSRRHAGTQVYMHVRAATQRNTHSISLPRPLPPSLPPFLPPSLPVHFMLFGESLSGYMQVTTETVSLTCGVFSVFKGRATWERQLTTIFCRWLGMRRDAFTLSAPSTLFNSLGCRQATNLVQCL